MDAHLAYEELTGTEHALGRMIPNLQNGPVNMNCNNNARPAPTVIAGGFDVFTVTPPSTVSFFDDFGSLVPSCFTNNVMELNYVKS